MYDGLFVLWMENCIWSKRFRARFANSTDMTDIFMHTAWMLFWAFYVFTKKTIWSNFIGYEVSTYSSVKNKNWWTKSAIRYLWSYETCGNVWNLIELVLTEGKRKLFALKTNKYYTVLTWTILINIVLLILIINFCCGLYQLMLSLGLDDNVYHVLDSLSFKAVTNETNLILECCS